jgi:biopolymer transport protein TolR
MPKLEPQSNGSSRPGGRRARGARVSSSLAEINVVPLVDVMLVLLIIFMVAAPLMQQGFQVQLPESKQSRAISAPVLVTVPTSFRRDRRVEIDGEFVRLEALEERVKQALNAKTKKDVILASDGDVTMSEVLAVFDVLQAGGVVNVNIQTQPPARRR